MDRRTMLHALAALPAAVTALPARAQSTKIVFGYTAVTDFASVFVAAEQGYFARRKLDVELKAINTLGIRGHLAKPSTYILDKKGQVRFAYVGKTTSDRPSIKAMLKELDGINKAS